MWPPLFLTGGDLYTLKRARPQGLGYELPRILASTLRHLLELPAPLTHGNVSMRSALLPRPGADVSELTLIDFGSAVDLSDCTRQSAEAALRADVVAFGTLVSELDADLSSIARACREGKYTSMADARLWRALSHPRRRWYVPWQR